MQNEELIKALREDAEWAHANEWETPITLGDHLDAAADRLEAADKREEAQMWIPVSERLPEKPYGCLVIVEQDDYWGEPREVMYPHFVGYDGEQWNDGDGEKIPLEVTHWRPLPDPPRKENEA